MTSSVIYGTTFDEDVQCESTNQCPECDGQVTTNAVETVCKNCGLVIDEQQINHGPEWRSFETDEDERARTGAPLIRPLCERAVTTLRRAVMQFSLLNTGKYRTGKLSSVAAWPRGAPSWTLQQLILVI